ncbi:hypothetical protein A3K29_05645 [Candidatus Collierbacteria bacterium RIFOXYB2_FULL_46_14]|uniref:Type II secretion system protein G n=1 Tax=Candidatus Collierbacteria bacterium GW2011_GWA2_46_26 TaxID=1618381 RepID=A0A0G1RRQ0_9BACT|nr:MAG: hypothetical protein UX47_C0009G0030 [Candidatus Collierbacteria bacterium GW2011_GWA2_46_26]OGD73572.1 MAG: hypothetical protein A3K29_05645 [Candidatus Collierbacteria bacterium RIFOXYB2_FULL_46_14]OGD76614.1 MAG: hypothetical protein A3K43_05645 [Candidatus Collierbacteria bacterium RIFOXYA2_FULL_46_20]OGD77950.1 MAG: hypothetical protein A3K39_05645 [Candidatus Collierbacteria bacterium RIFOXYC2_FULL_43_15]OGD79974.1 MAG: hypothetical protein A2320_00075 [Pseudomonadales bacterium G
MKHPTCPPKLRSCWRGFTLAELLIVITIIAVLAVLILLSLNPFTYFKRAYDTERKDDVYQLKNILESYYADHEYYPDLKVVLADCNGDSLQPYLDKVPCDPNTGAAYASYTLPVGSTKPQQYVIYAPTTSENFPDANTVDQCPDTLITSSPGISQTAIIIGCGGKGLCTQYYGCKNGACTQVSFDSTVSCTPNSCDSDCGGVDCAAQNGQGGYINECLP